MSREFGSFLAGSVEQRFLDRRHPDIGQRGQLRKSVARLAGSGTVIASIGWFVALAIGAFIFWSETPSQDGLAAHVSILSHLAECVIVTGFGFAILDALERNRRQMSRALGALQRTTELADQRGAVTATGPSIAHQEATIGSGSLNGRDYALFADGSLEIETLLGRRRFASILDAREFIADRPVVGQTTG
jgi:hypothetical protein